MPLACPAGNLGRAASGPATDKRQFVIQGQNDHLQPPRESELVFEAANNPKQYQLVDTGHLPQLEAPAMLAGLLSEWLSQISGHHDRLRRVALLRRDPVASRARREIDGSAPCGGAVEAPG